MTARRLVSLLALLLAYTACRRTPPAASGGESPRVSTIPSAQPAALPPTATCPIQVPVQAGDNREAIQAAIDAAASGDCGDVVVAPGSHEISGPIQLRSGVRLAGRRFKRTFSVIRPSATFEGTALLLTKFAPDSTTQRKQNEFYIESLRLDAAPRCPTRKNCAPARARVGLWLENTAYPTVRDCEFSNFPDGGAGVRGAGILYLKLMDSRFLSIHGWAIDLALQYAPRKAGTERANTYYAVSVGTIQRNYFAVRRGIRLTPGYMVTIRDNQFEGGLSMIHAYESTSSVLVIENNYFEVSPTAQDVAGRGTIALKGTGRVVGNLLVGPPKGKEGQYPGPAIDILASTSITIEDNTVRRFDPGVRIKGVRDSEAVRDRGNLIAPKAHVAKPWDFATSSEPPSEPPDPEPLERPEPE